MVSDQWAPAATPSSTPSPSNAPASAQTGTPAVTEDQKVLSAVAYILTWITGLIIFFVAKKEQRYARWHAVQAIGVGIVATVIGLVLNIISMVFAVAPSAATIALVGLIGLISMLLWLGVLIVVILSAVKAYQGQPIRLPVLAGFADKYA